jgi:nicotinate-nucleotide pyrophosphorylase (carboxylating)
MRTQTVNCSEQSGGRNDNMTPEQMREALALAGRRIVTQASGNVCLDTVRAIAETGVDLISIGTLTHTVTALDIGLDIEI